MCIRDSLQDATAQELHDSLGQAVMMAIHENWSRSKEKRATSRRAFYFSAEYLVGRMVYSNLYNLGILQPLRQAFQDKGIDLACLEAVSYTHLLGCGICGGALGALLGMRLFHHKTRHWYFTAINTAALLAWAALLAYRNGVFS